MTNIKISFDGKMKLGFTNINGVRPNSPSDNKRLRADFDFDFEGKFELEGTDESIAKKMKKFYDNMLQIAEEENKE